MVCGNFKDREGCSFADRFSDKWLPAKDVVEKNILPLDCLSQRRGTSLSPVSKIYKDFLTDFS
jgi:hypothetical protein